MLTHAKRTLLLWTSIVTGLDWHLPQTSAAVEIQEQDEEQKWHRSHNQERAQMPWEENHMICSSNIIGFTYTHCVVTNAKFTKIQLTFTDSNRFFKINHLHTRIITYVHESIRPQHLAILYQFADQGPTLQCLHTRFSYMPQTRGVWQWPLVDV